MAEKGAILGSSLTMVGIGMLASGYVIEDLTMFITGEVGIASGLFVLGFSSYHMGSYMVQLNPTFFRQNSGWASYGLGYLLELIGIYMYFDGLDAYNNRFDRYGEEAPHRGKAAMTAGIISLTLGQALKLYTWYAFSQNVWTTRKEAKKINLSLVPAIHTNETGQLQAKLDLRFFLP